MRRKGTPRAYPDYVTAQTVAGIHAAFEMLPFFIWSGAEYRFDNINLTKVTLYLIHNHRKTPKEPMRTVTGAFSFPVFSCHIRMSSVYGYGGNPPEASARLMQKTSH